MKIPRLPAWLLVWLAFAPLARPTTMIYPIEAIDDLWTLNADEFRQRYAGINISGLGPSDEGWYVRYRHANLTYLFGPLADREAARSKKWDMEAVRDAAIRNRQTLASSSVDFVRFTYSGVFGRAGDGSGGGGGDAPPRISADGRSGPDGDLDGDGIPNSQDDDMDGDGIPNGQDPDMDGDGIPNELDDYMYGTNPANGKAGEGSAVGGGDKKGGKGGNEGDKLAGKDGNSGGNDGKDGTSAGKDGKGGERGGSLGQQGTGQAGQQSSKSRIAQQGRQAGQQGSQSGQQGGQAGQQSQSSQSGQQGQSGSNSSSGTPSSGSQGPPSGSSGGSGNPLSLLAALLRKVLGL